MKHYQRIASGLIAAVVALPAMAASTHEAITPAEIASAVSSFGVPVASQQIELLTNVVATTAHPQLRVESIQRWDNRRMMARLSCASAGECLPFFVGLNIGQPAQPQPQPGASLRTVSAPAPPISAAPRSPSVRSGMPAILFLDGDHVHIRLTVICLQNGVTGQIIRATDKSHHVFYTAEVAENGILKGRL